MRTAKIVAAAVLMTTALYGCSQRSEAQAPPAPSVTVAVPLVRAVQDWDEFTGRFEATQSVEVRARVGGYISGVHFRDGDYVRRGQLLFSLDPRPAQAALASARAQLSQAQAQLALARSELARSELLLASEAVSQAEVDTRRGALQTAEAAIAAANASVRARQLDLEFTRVTAPISGRVSDRRVDAGNLVAGGSSAADVLTTVVSSAPIHFVFDGSEAVLLKYQRQARNGAAPIQVRLQDESDFSRSGTLDFTDNAVDAASGVVRLRALIPNADGFLKPGMFGQARLAGAGTYDAMLVPDASIATDQARRIVYVVAADGSVAPKPVQLGPLVDGLRVVRSGLARTDRVIINGVQRIQGPGMKVQARNGQIRPVAPPPQQSPVTRSAPASSATFANSLSSVD
ncbi:MAG: efflux RND transporter periplasmic adaptor subunit [Alphaproteobacteria bacterium]|uniref:efflux RND transporter periplasmic adaptor subunit n=1 Tax=Brevundimonas sp. TaxID=1871086 RepID=UPI0017E56FEC|nr:efflux RND transporter periplasmic adaptor subunit [Brevundimonas sp.]MBA3049856.1 efflux RND transporter periplasmic adaptor subunit [Brevundimonas sp.]MBU3971030.1 efflux RND transporter periplasmic adaptor subunit [Alphaproteobacteria bacterium]MBU4039726.1 efflux RND transporter periplasmic adaptor subunit [Alphaproteobacteria bacterium]